MLLRLSLRHMRKRLGFTLIEVLVALAVIAIAMGAAMKATLASTNNAIELKSRTAAGWVAQNRLNELAALGAWPEIGSTEGKESQAGMDFVWRVETGGSPNRSFRRVEIKVFSSDDNQHAVATLVSYLAHVSH
ncbi:type II secretion system protein GspI [Iodobacter fluviatilis]|jgi:general secretion pathway protein I|uniref:Type II secretion system protein I n=2 Tax=Iodobacter fluviatilis TaxID=537 RepID=A0A7G3G4J9_9NEIS|nr:type II secretion system protein GspI [Iodobacter fluviatilis]